MDKLKAIKDAQSFRRETGRIGGLLRGGWMEEMRLFRSSWLDERLEFRNLANARVVLNINASPSIGVRWRHKTAGRATGLPTSSETSLMWNRSNEMVATDSRPLFRQKWRGVCYSFIWRSPKRSRPHWYCNFDAFPFRRCCIITCHYNFIGLLFIFLDISAFDCLLWI